MRKIKLKLRGWLASSPQPAASIGENHVSSLGESYHDNHSGVKVIRAGYTMRFVLISTSSAMRKSKTLSQTSTQGNHLARTQEHLRNFS